MSKKRTIELANLVVLFGEKGLVESFKDRFYPAINDGKVNGKGEVKSYRFHKLKVANEDNTPIFYGRLLKFMSIEAEQDFDENQEKLVDSTRRMASVPSAFFTVDLNSHRISYLSETRRAPSLKDLQFCLRKLLSSDWKKQRQLLKAAMLEEVGKKRMNKGLKEEIEAKLDEMLPFPEVRVTPLPALQQLNKSLDPFHIITNLNIKPMLRNNELSNENAKFLRQLEKQQNKLKAKTTTLNVANSKDGLKKDEVKKLVKEASSGNYAIKVKGKDQSGEDIDSDLKEISVKFKEEIPNQEPDVNRAKRLLTKMKEAFERKYVLASEVTQEIKDAAKALVRDLTE